MGGIQTIFKLRHSATFVIGLFTLITLATATFLHPSVVYAACGTGEYVGSSDTNSAENKKGATDPKKCYKDTSIAGQPRAEATSNTPDGAANPDRTGSPTEDDKNEDETTCAVEKIGWMLCPVIEGAAKMSDRLFDFLANSLLEIEPELFSVNNSGSGKVNGTYNAWTQAKDLANVAFIIAFVIIVISQVTNYGIGNYGIKRMLPRLIIAAIFVNISYFICQGMADISNILGYNVHQALTDIAKSVGPTPFENTQGVNTQTSDGFLGKIALAVLAIAGIVWLLLAPLGAVILFIVITVLTIVIILLLRKAFIVILVVISPLAFVAYLLPNTEQYFKKWLTMFWKLLLVFPIVALLMGGGQLASAIILSTGADTQQAKPSANCKTTDNKDSNSKGIDEGNPCEGTVELTSSTGDTKHVRWSLGLIAAGVAVAPLLAVWSVLQGALSAAGAIGGKMAAAVSRAQDRQKGKLGEANKKRREFLGNRMQARALDDGKLGSAINAATLGGARRGVRRQAKYDYAKSAFSNAKMGYIADQAVDENGKPTQFGRQLAGGMLATDQTKNKVAADAVNAQRKLEIDEVKAASATIERLDIGADEHDEGSLMNLAAKGRGDDPRVAAALEQLGKIDKKKAFAAMQHRLDNNLDGGKANAVTRVSSGVMSSSGYFSGSQVAAMQNGTLGSASNPFTGGFEAQAKANLTNGSVSANNLAGMSASDIDFLDNLTTGNPAARAHVQKAYRQMSQDQRGNLSQEKQGKLGSF